MLDQYYMRPLHLLLNHSTIVASWLELKICCYHVALVVQLLCICNTKAMRERTINGGIIIGVMGQGKQGKSMLVSQLVGYDTGAHSRQRTWDICLHRVTPKLSIMDFPHMDGAAGGDAVAAAAFRIHHSLLSLPIGVVAAATGADNAGATTAIAAVYAAVQAKAQLAGETPAAAGMQGLGSAGLICFNKVRRAGKVRAGQGLHVCTAAHLPDAVHIDRSAWLHKRVGLQCVIQNWSRPFEITMLHFAALCGTVCGHMMVGHYAVTKSTMTDDVN
jgi:hypothetical protein